MQKYEKIIVAAIVAVGLLKQRPSCDREGTL